MNDDLIGQVFHKIEREKALINGANAMRQSSNPQVQQSLDAQIREARKNIGYLEERMRELQMRRMGQGPEDTGDGRPMPPDHRTQPSHQQAQRNGPSYPKQGVDPYSLEQAGYGAPPGPGGYMDQLGAGTGVMPPRPPFGPSAPGTAVPKARPNYSKLGEPSAGGGEGRKD